MEGTVFLCIFVKKREYEISAWNSLPGAVAAPPSSYHLNSGLSAAPFILLDLLHSIGSYAAI